MSPRPPGFSRVVKVGAVPPGLPEGDSFAIPDGLEDGSGRLAVADLVEIGAAVAPEARPLLVLTDRDLTLAGCGSLFGYADRQRGIAIVSTFRLSAGATKDVLRARVDNETAHELGHLAGFEHCSQEGCVMRPVTRPEELDTRERTACGRCSAGGRWSRATKWAAAALFFVASLAALNYVLSWAAGPLPPTPFACLTHRPTGEATPAAAGRDDIAHIHFRGRDLFCIRDRNGAPTVRSRSLPFVRRMNELWRSEHAPELVVVATGPSSARIDAGGSMLIEVLPRDVAGGDALATARAWKQALAAALADRSDAP